MVADELEPAGRGNVECNTNRNGRISDYPVIARMIDDVNRHGEVHATFEEVDKEVEVRLGTAKFNFVSSVIEVFDGDQYHPFTMESLVTWEVPMDLYH